MTRGTRFRYSEADKALMWDRWQKGDSIHEIARHFGRYHSPIQRILSENGGVRPAPRKRSRLALSLPEREDISRGLVAGNSMRSIAKQLGRSPSTISREIRRNKHRRGYRASRADQAAWDRALRPKRCKLAFGVGTSHLDQHHVPGMTLNQCGDQCLDQAFTQVT